jgi:hypothetical protein
MEHSIDPTAVSAVGSRSNTRIGWAPVTGVTGLTLRRGNADHAGHRDVFSTEEGTSLEFRA